MWIHNSNPEYYFAFHKGVKCLEPYVVRNMLEEKRLNKQLSVNGRKEIEAKMATALNEKIKGLSVELQNILIDDMVTAFENRLSVFKRVNIN
jgi:hypothetical protein